MPKSRSQLVNLTDTAYYHCTSRCVRRAFLCGDDPLTKRNFDHRRKIIEQRLLFLASVYAVEILAFAIMSNHLHLVLKINTEKAMLWDDNEVVTRWHSVHLGHTLTRAFCKNGHVAPTQQDSLNKLILTYKERLSSLSWFMRDLNEYIARVANTEDDCKGHFWEGRFKSQALLDEEAVITCMAYVDLNPIRANLADSLEKSDFTSIKIRIVLAKINRQPSNLVPFVPGKQNVNQTAISFSFQDYLRLLNASSQIIRGDKPGFLKPNDICIFSRLNIKPESWLSVMQNFEYEFTDQVGTLESLQRYYFKHHYKRRPNIFSTRL